MSRELGKRNYSEACTLMSLLKMCAAKRDLGEGKRLHAEILKKTALLDRNPFLASSLINMYAKCGKLAKARQVLDGLCLGNIHSFNALIAGYAHHGQDHEAFNCFHRMQNEGLLSDAITFISTLKACSKARVLSKGKQIHGGILSCGLLDKDIVLGSALIDMYAKCGELAKAEQVLEELPVRDVVSWSSVIGGYAQEGKAREALLCFEKMLGEGLSPDVVTFISLLKVYGTIGELEKGKEIHNEIAGKGLLEQHISLGNSLMDMYVRCGVLAKAQEVLRQLPARNVISWNILISGYSHHRHWQQAVHCFEEMQREGVVPDAVTFISLLKACGLSRAIREGEKLHEEIVNRGIMERNIMLGNALLDMYMKCGMCIQAQEVLEGMHARDLISWNVLIAGYTQQGKAHEALNCLECMEIEGLSPNTVTFICISKACGLTRDIQKGKIIHKKILNTSLLKKDIGLGNALIDMYAKCGVLTEAHCVLEELSIRSVISWSALIAGYVQNGQGHEALNCFEQMQNEGLFPDTVTFLSLMKSCGSTGDIEKGKQIHNAISCSGLLEKEIMLANALVDMYSKCGMLEKAQVVLEAIPFRDIVSWNALITGYVQQGRCCEALKFFRLMQSEGLSPDAVTYLCTLKACGSTGSIDNGIHIHNKVVDEKLLDKGTVLGNALVAMYVKCGSLAKAHAVHEELPIRNLVSWSALVLGYAQNSLGREAMNCLERMQFEGISPDEVIFLGILSACSHSGLLDEAQIVFESMIGTYEILPSLKHHICMVMGFGFAGQFDKAMSVIEVMPCFQYPSVWLALLSTCGKWGNVNLGQLAFNHGIIPGKNCPLADVFMANIISAAGMHKESGESKPWH